MRFGVSHNRHRQVRPTCCTRAFGRLLCFWQGDERCIFNDVAGLYDHVLSHCVMAAAQIRLDLPSVKLQFPLDQPPVHPDIHPVQEAIGSFTSYAKVLNCNPHIQH